MSNIGDGIHNFMDGLIIASSFLAGIPAGIATTVAVVLHEIPSEIGNVAVMLHDGFTRGRALFWNFLSALTAVLGAVVVLAGSASAASLNQYMLPFAAGNLLYIAGSDLIPELHREEGLRKAFFQLLCMVGGIAIMGVMLLLE